MGPTREALSMLLQKVLSPDCYYIGLRFVKESYLSSEMIQQCNEAFFTHQPQKDVSLYNEFIDSLQDKKTHVT